MFPNTCYDMTVIGQKVVSRAIPLNDNLSHNLMKNVRTKVFFVSKQCNKILAML